MKSDFLIGAAIGSGSMALAAERGGADLLLAINAGRLRNMGAPSIACMLPIANANGLTDGFAREELLALCRVPVLLGVNVWGRDYNPVGLAEGLREAGFAGAVNFPSCMHYSRPMQQILSRAGRGIEREVEQLRAVQDAGLTTMFYCATRTQARLAADAGIDFVCLNLGWNVGGALGHRMRASIEEVATAAREIGRLIKRINPQTRFLLEGGPIATPEDLGRVLSLAPIDGYVGGSTIERMPLEVSVADRIDGFRQASKRSAALDSESARLVTWSKQFGFVGRSEAHLSYLRRLRALAAAREPVLLLVEPGLDPQPALRAMESGGGSRGSVQVDVAREEYPARSRNLLFGHRDTLDRRQPLLGDASVDLLVVHAPERLSPAVQRRLAAALREGRFRAPGARRSFAVGPRVVLVCAATVVKDPSTTDLEDLGLDRDLVALVAGWVLRQPPLRERGDDLLAIIEATADERLGVALDRASFSAAALQVLQAHTWPGNEAELRTLLGGLAGRSWREPVQPQELQPQRSGETPRVSDSRGEKDRIVDALWRNGFSRTRTAAALGMSRKTLYNKIKKFGLSG